LKLQREALSVKEAFCFNTENSFLDSSQASDTNQFETERLRLKSGRDFKGFVASAHKVKLYGNERL
jgi:hypothetical protein